MGVTADGPGERTGVEAVRGGASGGTGWGRGGHAPYPAHLGMAVGQPLVEANGRAGGASQSHRVLGVRGGARGFERGPVTPQRPSTQGSQARSVSTSWELREGVDGQDRLPGPEQDRLRQKVCGGSGGLCVPEPSRILRLSRV